MAGGQMIDLLHRVWEWSLASRARNWAAHAALALAIALVVGAVVRFLSGPAISSWAAGAFTAGGFYVLKEIEDALISSMFEAEVQWLDVAGDAFFPALAVALLQFILG